MTEDAQRSADMADDGFVADTEGLALHGTAIGRTAAPVEVAFPISRAAVVLPPITGAQDASAAPAAVSLEGIMPAPPAGSRPHRLSSARGRASAVALPHPSCAASGPDAKAAPAASSTKEGTVRCGICNKKIGLASQQACRCGHMFCVQHRHAEAHNCDFDYKGVGREVLRESNPAVQAPKLPKI
jgi:hypothetical protein